MNTTRQARPNDPIRPPRLHLRYGTAPSISDNGSPAHVATPGNTSESPPNRDVVVRSDSNINVTHSASFGGLPSRPTLTLHSAGTCVSSGNSYAATPLIYSGKSRSIFTYEGSIEHVAVRLYQVESILKC